MIDVIKSNNRYIKITSNNETLYYYLKLRLNDA